jgi:hypothetical protein
MQIEVKTIGPDEARAMLNRNDANRNIRPLYVMSLAQQMTQGFWRLAGDPIRLDAEGNLLDGQHRLSAVIESKTAHDFVIIVGLDADTQNVMDSGIKRSFSDVLKMRGEGSANVLAGITRGICLWEQGYRPHDFLGGQVNPGHSALLKTFEAHPEIRIAANVAQRLDKKYRLPARVLGIGWIQFGSIDAADRDSFFDRMMRLDFNGENDPLSRLYTVLTQDALSIRRLPTLSKYALLIKTWNFYRDGAEVKSLRWRRGGSKPESFPEPY